MRSATKTGKHKDKAYLAWLATLPCLVTGRRPVTVHHVRFCGSPRDDRRTVPLVAEVHMLTHERDTRYWRRGIREKEGVFGPCVERSKRMFEQYWKTDLEAAIVLYNATYEKLKGQNGQSN